MASAGSPSSRQITILYGSQTGNAIDVSERIAFELQRKWFQVKLMSMSEYVSTLKAWDPSNPFPAETVMIFVASTTGQGDVPNNMKVRVCSLDHIPMHCTVQTVHDRPDILEVAVATQSEQRMPVLAGVHYVRFRRLRIR